ncbi:Protein of unknown function (DUF3231) [Acididesulfobacillus acetoxydans]|uniref:Transcriptional regulator Spx n=1 Tax=Acididesulfobacillus acetoxydans TaxID=1561005 RepID=A0A8S0WRF1_9FIRM|nr:DUF3231 family protein [Acididesulfobacillus acetoxydans]CAA7603264.1 Protein of unknown function (DUF3231) [Acididesulfobacillus acetoxydans]CEJ07235.1 Transcriptional regulator Spx [Acididesulfobacillus acetoxydans]
MNNLEQGINGTAAKAPYHAIQHNPENIQLTAAEIGQLWTMYLAESMGACMLPYFAATSKDPDIHAVLQFALDASARHVQTITAIFEAAYFPIPHGFRDEDFDVSAKPLYSETFMLLYTTLMAKYAILGFGLAYTSSSRPDVRQFFEGCLNDSTAISKKGHAVLLAKGLLPRAAYVPIPDRVEYTHDVQGFYKGLIGDKRPLNALEIDHLFVNIISRSLRNTLTTGFEQTTKSKLIKDYLSRGRLINDKQIDILSQLLEDADLSTLPNYDHLVTESLESPFSDKLILFHFTTMTANAIAAGGLALSNSTRSDIILTFGRFIAELGDLAKDGVNLMIKQGWLERVPEAANRKELSTQ